MTPKSTSAAPASWIQCIGSPRIATPSPIVKTGPSEPISDDAFAPMRCIASAISHVGSTVDTTAIASDSA